MSIVSKPPVRSGAIRRAQCLTATLRTALETPTVLGYGGEEGSPTGANLVTGVWEPPDAVTEEDLAAARIWLHAYEAETAEVTESDAKKWLATFLNNVAVNTAYSERDLDLKITTLWFAVNDRKAKHFTVDSLKLAWKRFTFIPAARELMQFFDDLEELERTQAQRLMKVLDHGIRGKADRPGPQDPRFTWSKAEAEAQARRNYEAKAAERREMLRSLGGEPISTPPRVAGETEREYGIRLAQFAKEMCRLGAFDAKRRIERAIRESQPMPPVNSQPTAAAEAERKAEQVDPEGAGDADQAERR